MRVICDANEEIGRVDECELLPVVAFFTGQARPSVGVADYLARIARCR
jgi:hypothetical protein